MTELLRAFFSHEGRVVPELAQNVDAILEHPGRGFFTVADHAGVATTTIHISTGGGCSAVIEESGCSPRRAVRAWAQSSCARRWPSAGGAASSRSSCA